MQRKRKDVNPVKICTDVNGCLKMFKEIQRKTSQILIKPSVVQHRTPLVGCFTGYPSAL